MKISINIVTYNGMPYLDDCLNSILKQSFSSYQIIFFDNGSTDGTKEWISQFKNSHKEIPIFFLQSPLNTGFSYGNNRTIEESATKYVLQLNQDTVLDENFLSEGIAYLDAHPEAGGITGKIYRLTDGKKTDTIDSLGHNVSKRFEFIERFSGKREDENSNVPSEVISISGTAPIFRKKALEEVRYENEYFDENFFAYKEDIDLSLRLRLIGWKLYFCPQAILYHKRSLGFFKEKKNSFSIIRNWKSRSIQANFYSYQNHCFLLLKMLPATVWKKFFLPITVYEMQKIVFLLFFHPILFLKIIWSLIFFWKKIREKRKFFFSGRKIDDELFLTQWMRNNHK